MHVEWKSKCWVICPDVLCASRPVPSTCNDNDGSAERKLIATRKGHQGRSLYVPFFISHALVMSMHKNFLFNVFFPSVAAWFGTTLDCRFLCWSVKIYVLPRTESRKSGGSSHHQLLILKRLFMAQLCVGPLSLQLLFQCLSLSANISPFLNFNFLAELSL